MLLKNPNLNQIMIKKSVTVSPDTKVLDAREILFRHKIRRLVVLSNNRIPVGIVTEKDIAKAIYKLGNKPIKSIKIRDFMSKKLVTVNKKSSIYDCARLMKNRKIGSVIVLNEDKTLAGLITKTDIVSVFLTQSAGSLKVSKIMTSKVITAMPEDSILFVESLLINNKISRIVIQRNRKPVGIITHRNFLPAKIPHWIAETADPKEVEKFKRSQELNEFRANQLSYLLPFKAVDIMTSQPITIDANEDVSVAALLMVRHRIGGLPVIRNSILVGIITKSDIIRAIAEH